MAFIKRVPSGVLAATLRSEERESAEVLDMGNLVKFVKIYRLSVTNLCQCGPERWTHMTIKKWLGRSAARKASEL
jgi:hypothetical protein